MQLLHNVHGFHVIFGLFCVVRLIFIFGKWKWLSQALSEKGTPSSFRVSGYNLIELICLCEFWHTMKSGRFEYTHLVALLVSVGVLLGLIKTAQLLQVMGRGGKGNGGPDGDNPFPPYEGPAEPRKRGFPVFENPPAPPPPLEKEGFEFKDTSTPIQKA